MNIDRRRGVITTNKAIGKVDRDCLSAETVSFGRWQRSHNSVYFCCGFIFTSFALLTALSFRFEPSIPIGTKLQPVTWKQDSDFMYVSEDVSVMENRRILSGGMALTSLEVVEQDVTKDQRRQRDSKLVHRQQASLDSEDGWIDSNNSRPLGLASSLKIFVYNLPSKFNSNWLNDSRCSNHLFAAEVALHQILLKSPLRTTDPEVADYFFVPVYVSCNFSSKNGFPSLGNAVKMIRGAVDIISKDMGFWNRKSGSDHVFVATHDYGACFHAIEDLAVSAGVPKFLRNSIILQTFGQKDGRHPCQDVENILIPPYVSPEMVQTHWSPVEKQERDIFAYFRGKLEIHSKNVSGHVYSNGIRTLLWHRFKNNEHFFLRRKRLEGYQFEMLRSVFCLAPRGWAPWSPRIVESVVYGCIPVIIADDIALPHSHVIDWPNMSLTVRESDLEQLDQILRHVASTNLTIIQQNLWKEENRRALLYTQPLLRGDASWHIFDLLAGIKALKQHEKALLSHGSFFEEIAETRSAGESFRFTSV